MGKVMVTGAGGTLGSQVVAHLVEEGWHVLAHDRRPHDTAAAEVVTGDLRDRNQVRAALAGVDAVVHAAAIPSPDGAPEDEIFANNVQAAYTVLAEAGRAEVGRIVNVSSVSAIGLAWSQRGLSPLTAPVTEDHPYVGEDIYGLSKQLTEIVAAALSRRWGGSVVTLRFPFIGTGERLSTHLAGVHGDPGSDRGALWAWVDTRDAARAIAAALAASPPGHHLVTITAADTTALQPTRELLARYHPGTTINRELAGFASVFNTDLARNLLGFVPIHGWRQS